MTDEQVILNLKRHQLIASCHTTVACAIAVLAIAVAAIVIMGDHNE